MEKIQLNNSQYTFNPNSLEIGKNGVFVFVNGEMFNVAGRAVNIIQSEDGSGISFNIEFLNTNAGEEASKIKNIRLDTFQRNSECGLKDDGTVWVNKFTLFAINIIS